MEDHCHAHQRGTDEDVEPAHEGHQNSGKAADPVHAPQHDPEGKGSQNQSQDRPGQRGCPPSREPDQGQSPRCSLKEGGEAGADAADLNEGPNPTEPGSGAEKGKRCCQRAGPGSKAQANIGKGPSVRPTPTVRQTVTDGQKPLGVFEGQACERAELHPEQGPGSSQGQGRGHANDISGPHGGGEGRTEGREGADAVPALPSLEGQTQALGQSPERQKAEPNQEKKPRSQEQQKQGPAPKGLLQAY